MVNIWMSLLGIMNLLSTLLIWIPTTTQWERNYYCFPFYRQRNAGRDWVLKATQPVCGRTGIKTSHQPVQNPYSLAEACQASSAILSYWKKVSQEDGADLFWRPCRKTHHHESKPNNPWVVCVQVFLPSLVLHTGGKYPMNRKDSHHEW